MISNSVSASRRCSVSSFALGGLALAFTLAFTGCATKASRLPRKDLTVLQPGVAREVVIDELGQPASTTTSRAGTTVDVFTFVQGTKPSGKPPRPVEPEQAEAHEWMQLLGQAGKSPLGYLDGKKLSVQVNYDAGLRVKDTVLLRVE